MNALSRLSLMLLVWLGIVPVAVAQPAPFRSELFTLLPDDFAVCVVLHDLRGHAARWEQSDWLKAFRASGVGKSILETPEVRQLERWQSEMKKHLDLDWPTLRDDILGETLILAYSPGPRIKPDDERGLFLLSVRKPERLIQVIDRLNEVQTKSGEVKLSEKQYKGHTYYRRVQSGKEQYYSIKESLAAVATKEEIMRAFLDRRSAPPTANPWAERFQRAGGESALATMFLNPRLLDAEVLQKGKKDDPIFGYWRALEAVFVTVTVRDDAELRFAVQADTNKLPGWAKSAFLQTAPASSLWQRFPEPSIVTLASRIDFTGGADGLTMLMPEKDRKKLSSDWQRSIGALQGLDPFKDILPNVGPDWGVCVLPSKDPQHLPQTIFALAVKPGSKEQPVDQALFEAVKFFAGIAVLEYNKNNPNSLIRLQTLMQEKVEVKYLTNDKLFPPGFRPACALKDGYLLIATSPEATANFRLRANKLNEGKGIPLLRISAPELAKLLQHRREHILNSLTDRKQMSAPASE